MTRPIRRTARPTDPCGERTRRPAGPVRLGPCTRWKRSPDSAAPPSARSCCAQPRASSSSGRLRRGEVVRVGAGPLRAADRLDGARAARRLSGAASHRSAAAGHGWGLAFQPERPEVVVPRNRNVPPARRVRRGAPVAAAVAGGAGLGDHRALPHGARLRPRPPVHERRWRSPTRRCATGPSTPRCSRSVRSCCPASGRSSRAGGGRGGHPARGEPLRVGAAGPGA